MSHGWPLDPTTGAPYSPDALRAQARAMITRQEAERVITEGSTRRFLLCTASFGISYPNPLKG